MFHLTHNPIFVLNRLAMKRFYLYALLFSMTACEQQNVTEIALPAAQAFNPEAEKEAILKVIEHETAAFFNRDYESWQQYFAQTEYAFQAWNQADGGFSAEVGWRAVT